MMMGKVAASGALLPAQDEAAKTEEILFTLHQETNFRQKQCQVGTLNTVQKKSINVN